MLLGEGGAAPPPSSQEEGRALPSPSRSLGAGVQRGLLRALAAAGGKGSEEEEEEEEEARVGKRQNGAREGPLGSRSAEGAAARREAGALMLASLMFARFGSAWLRGEGSAAGSPAMARQSPLAPGVFLTAFARLLGVSAKSVLDELETSCVLEASVGGGITPLDGSGGGGGGSAEAAGLGALRVTPLTRAQRSERLRRDYDAQATLLALCVDVFASLVRALAEAEEEEEEAEAEAEVAVTATAAGGPSPRRAAGPPPLTRGLPSALLHSLHTSLDQSSAVLLEFIVSAWNSDLRPLLEGGPSPAAAAAAAAGEGAAAAAGAPPAAAAAAAELRSLPLRAAALRPLLALCARGAGAYLAEDARARCAELALALPAILSLGAADAEARSMEGLLEAAGGGAGAGAPQGRAGGALALRGRLGGALALRVRPPTLGGTAPRGQQLAPPLADPLAALLPALCARLVPAREAAAAAAALRELAGEAAEELAPRTVRWLRGLCWGCSAGDACAAGAHVAGSAADPARLTQMELLRGEQAAALAVAALAGSQGPARRAAGGTSAARCLQGAARRLRDAAGAHGGAQDAGLARARDQVELAAALEGLGEVLGGA